MISLIIPTYNKLERLRLTIESLRHQTLDRDMYELILVDDNSKDGTDSFIEAERGSFDFNFKYIRHSENLGRSHSRNTGIDNSSGDYLVFTDDDCIMSPEFLETHYKHMQEGYAVHGAIWNLSYLKFFKDPVKGILFDEFKNANVQSLIGKCISHLDIGNNFSRIEMEAKKTRFEKEIERALKSHTTTFPWISSTGGNIAVYAKDIRRIGAFDEKLGKQWGAEDIEMGYRLYKMGIHFKYLDRAAVYHIDHYRMNSAELSKKAMEYMYDKHRAVELKSAFDCFFNGLLDYGLWEKTYKEESGD